MWEKNLLQMATRTACRKRFFSRAGGRLLAPAGCGEGADDLDQRRAEAVQLLEMDGREVPEVPLGGRHQADEHAAAVPKVVPSLGEPGPGQPVHQLDRAMMADAQALREIVDAERLAVWVALARAVPGAGGASGRRGEPPAR